MEYPAKFTEIMYKTSIKKMAQVQGSEATCICSEEDLQRVIELEAWYDSEGESSSESETEETDSSPNLNYYSIEV